MTTKDVRRLALRASIEEHKARQADINLQLRAIEWQREATKQRIECMTRASAQQDLERAFRASALAHPTRAERN